MNFSEISSNISNIIYDNKSGKHLSQNIQSDNYINYSDKNISLINNID